MFFQHQKTTLHELPVPLLHYFFCHFDSQGIMSSHVIDITFVTCRKIPSYFAFAKTFASAITIHDF